MELSDDQIEKFQQLYEKHSGEKISAEKAAEVGLKLVQLVKVVYKPITKVEYNNARKGSHD